MIKDHTVVVEEGSGVLIQPMTDQYSYILTAKHNLQINPKDGGSDLKSHNCIKLTTFDAESYEANLFALDIHPHETLDIAIIIIAFYPGLTITAYQKEIILDDGLWLYGYPGTRRNRTTPVRDWINSYKLEVQDPGEEKVSFRNTSFAPKEDIDGFSGGGLFYIDDAQKKVFLASIEYAMENAKEANERLKGIPITAFESIIKKYSIAPLKPLHLSSFKHLKDTIFPQSYYEHLATFKWKDFSHVIEILKRFVIEGADNILLSPEEILKENKQALMVKNQHLSVLDEEQLWSAVLELIVMKSILDIDNLNELELVSDVNYLFNEFRFVYLDTDKGWESHYEEIMTINTDSLNDDGKIILIIGGDKVPDVIIDQEDIEEVIDNISNANSSYYIDNATRINEKKFPIIHWLSLHDKCIFQTRSCFKEFKSIRHSVKNLEVLKEHYKPYLNG